MKPKPLHLAFLFVVLSLLAAVASGWLRLGVPLPFRLGSSQHGALMVNSFLASVIFLERAVTFRQKWLLLLPLTNAASALFFVADFPQIGFWFLNTAGLGFAALCLHFLFRYKEFYFFVFLLGSLLLVIGNVMITFSGHYTLAVYYWMGFLLLTIVAERLELSRFLPVKKSAKTLLVACLLLTLVALVVQTMYGYHQPLAVTIAGTALWLLRYDMARRSLRLPGQHRYSAVALLGGFGWLLATAPLLLFFAKIPFGYDAVLHAFFIGFVFSMIFSHAPIIVPAVAKLPVKVYRPVLYAWLAGLHLSLLVRLAGDVWGEASLRKTGGLLNGLVVLGFFVTIAATVVQEKRRWQLQRKAAAALR